MSKQNYTITITTDNKGFYNRIALFGIGTAIHQAINNHKLPKRAKLTVNTTEKWIESFLKTSIRERRNPDGWYYKALERPNEKK